MFGSNRLLLCVLQLNLPEGVCTYPLCFPLTFTLAYPSVFLLLVSRYVYQKAYVEFFVSPSKLDALLSKLEQHPSITYMAVNKEGDVESNMKQDTVNAVTWGVFPGGSHGGGVTWVVSHGGLGVLFLREPP